MEFACATVLQPKGEKMSVRIFFSERATNQGYTVLLRKKKVQIEGQGILP